MAGAHSHSPHAAPLRTLVVDDSEPTLQTICGLLGANPNIVVVDTATNARSALEKATRCNPALVLMDIEMPVMNGIAATPELKKLCPAAQVVLFSVHDYPGLRTLCRQCGAAAFISKESLGEELPTLLDQLRNNISS